MEGMNQAGVDCMHIWKCHNEIPVQLLYTNKNVSEVFIFNFKKVCRKWFA
jgi:hypothetical protein